MTKYEINKMDHESIIKICKILSAVNTLMVRRHDDFLPVSILIIESCLISGHPDICKTVGVNLGLSLEGLLGEIKDSALIFFFDIVEIFIIVSKEYRKELMYFVMEKVTRFSFS